MIKEITGNLLDFPEGINVLVHQANCQNIMGAGIAAQIARRYPQAYAADQETKKGDYDKLGLFSSAKLDDGKIIVNLYAQYDVGTGKRMTSYDALADGFTHLKESILASEKAASYIIGIPHGMGCGLGGGSWNVVKAIVESVFQTSSIPVIIVKLP